MVWTWIQYDLVFGSFGLLFNTGIHVFMYYYYFASSLGWNVWYKKYITSAQIIQFMSSFVLSVVYIYYHQAKNCPSWGVFLFGMSINFTFLALFISFYSRTYTGKRKLKMQ
jgi:fatty acid elongase 3